MDISYFVYNQLKQGGLCLRVFAYCQVSNVSDVFADSVR